MGKLQRHLARGGAFLFLAFGATAPATAQGDGAPPFPPPGRLVDIGGWRLHLNCTGASNAQQPTVILEAGIGDFSVEWSLVQPGVAKFARVCSYDRADDGWSDFGPHPRTMHQNAFELHKLLETAGIAPPYVLVGHSYGGGIVRLFRMMHPDLVAGMVLVEAGSDDPWRMLGDGKLRRSSELATGRPIPPPITAGPLRASDIPPQALASIQDAIARSVPIANEAPRNKLPAEAQRMRTWAMGTVKHWGTSDNPFEADELLLLSRDRTRKEYPYGDMPLVVITRGLSEEGGPDSKQFEEEHRKEHEAVARLSRAGKLIVAIRSGHHVQIDEPQLVIDAIRQVVSTPRK